MDATANIAATPLPTTAAAAKRERTKLRRERVTEPRMVACGRCGGAGGSDMWARTGWTCYACMGQRSFERDVRVYADPALEARDAALTAIIDDEAAAIATAEFEAMAGARYDALWIEAQEALVAHDENVARLALQTWIGEVGEKITAAGIVKVAATIDGYYGSTRLVIIETADGNLVKTFGTGASLFGVETGDAVTIAGTVKSLDFYRGDKQTVLTRAKITVG